MYKAVLIGLRIAKAWSIAVDNVLTHSGMVGVFLGTDGTSRRVLPSENKYTLCRHYNYYMQFQ